MTAVSKIRKGDRVSIPAVLTGTVLEATPVAANATGTATVVASQNAANAVTVKVQMSDGTVVQLTVPESHDITLHQITLRENK